MSIKEKRYYDLVEEKLDKAIEDTSILREYDKICHQRELSQEEIEVLWLKYYKSEKIELTLIDDDLYKTNMFSFAITVNSLGEAYCIGKFNEDNTINTLNERDIMILHYID